MQLTPLYHSASLLRGLTTGVVDASLLWHVLYLGSMFVICIAVTIRLMRRRFTD